MRLSELIYISKRLNSNLKHGRFYRIVSFVAVLSVMVGTFAILVSMSVLQGFEEQMAESAVNFTSQIKIDKYEGRLIGNYTRVQSAIKSNFAEVKSVSPHVQKEALISTKKSIDGIILKGLEYSEKGTVISDKIVNGVPPKRGERQIIIGYRLAERAGIALGDSVLIYLLKSNSESELPDVFKMQVIGAYRTGMAKYDDIVVYGDITALSRMLELPDGTCTGFDLMLNDTKLIDATTIKIENFLKFPYSVLSVYDIHASMFNWIEMQKEPIPIVLGLISIVAIMNIITILLILIVEKTHTIGILRTLGMKSSSILGVFLIRGTSIGMIGTLLGAGLALLLTWLQQSYKIIKLNGEIYFLDAMPIAIELSHYAYIIVISISISFIVTLLPALIALKIKAIKAINFR